MELIVQSLYATEIKNKLGGDRIYRNNANRDINKWIVSVSYRAFEKYCITEENYSEGIIWEDTIESYKFQLSLNIIKALLVKKPSLFKFLLRHVSFDYSYDYTEPSENTNINELLFIEYFAKYADCKDLFTYDKIKFNYQILETLEIELALIGMEDEIRHVRLLSNNCNVYWGAPILKRYKNYFDWEQLSANESIQFTDEIIDEFCDYWDWFKLSSNKSLEITKSRLEKYSDKWNWSALSTSPSINFDNEIIEQFVLKWNWPLLSKKSKFTWTTYLYEKYRHYINLIGIAQNLNVEWDSVYPLFLDDISLANKIQKANATKKSDVCLQLLSYNPSFTPTIAQIKKAPKFCLSVKGYNKQYDYIDTTTIYHPTSTSILFNNQNYGSYLEGHLRISFIDNEEPSFFPAVIREYTNKIIHTFYPSLSSNAGIVWTEELLLSFYHEIDFWIVAWKGKISWQLVVKFSMYFDEIRYVGSRFGRKHSDYGTSRYYDFKTGWENLVDNPNFVITEDFLVWAAMRKTRIKESIEVLYGDDINLQRTIENLNKPGTYKLITVRDIFIKRYLADLTQREN